MADLLIICDNQRQADELYHRTYRRLANINPAAVKATKSRNRMLIRYEGDSARFVTVYQIKHSLVDRGFHGIRITGDAFDRAMDNVYNQEIIKHRNKE